MKNVNLFQVSYPTISVGIDGETRPDNPVTLEIPGNDPTNAFIDGTNEASRIISKRPRVSHIDTSRFPLIVKIG